MTVNSQKKKSIRGQKDLEKQSEDEKSERNEQNKQISHNKNIAGNEKQEQQLEAQNVKEKKYKMYYFLARTKGNIHYQVILQIFLTKN